MPVFDINHVYFRRSDYQPVTSDNPIRESDSFTVEVVLNGFDSGTYVVAPTLTIEIDANFDNIFSADERLEESGIDVGYHEGLTVVFRDDGKPPGDGGPSNAAKVHIHFGNSGNNDIDTTIEVKNVDPVFVSAPVITRFRNADDKLVVRAAATIFDPSNQESFKFKANWGGNPSDNTEHNYVYSAALDDPNLSKYRDVVVDRIVENESTFVALPLVLTIADDDTGLSKYTLKAADVIVNKDDDNTNNVEDLHDYGFADNDLIEFPIGDFITDTMRTGTGQYILQANNSAVLMWDSATKTKQINSYYGGSNSGYTGESIPYTGQQTIWLEGVSPGSTTITLAWQGTPAGGSTGDGRPIYGGSVTVTSWGIDVDIDSDNTQAIEHSNWEETLEDNPYGLGKLIYPTDPQYTPVKLTIVPGLDPSLTSSKIQFDFLAGGHSGLVYVWNRAQNDPLRDPSTNSVLDGGSRIFTGEEYTLSDLNYNSATGQIEVYIQAIQVYAGHDTKQDVITRGKPLDVLKAKLITPTTATVSDSVRYMVVTTATFYPTLNAGIVIRSAIASEGVYGPLDLPQYALELISPSEVTDLLQVDPLVAQLLQPNYMSAGFKAGLYRDYVSGDFVLAFAGTEYTPLTPDWLNNIWQASGHDSPQYDDAMELASFLRDSAILRQTGWRVTGHSLGGGLASAASVVAGVHADTFNASGLRRETLLVHGLSGNVVYPEQEIYPGSLANYAAATTLITAFYLDWDILSFAQDHPEYQVVLFGTLWPTTSLPYPYPPDFVLPQALGLRFEMDGPLDLEIGALAYAAPAAFALMAFCHKNDYLQYGLLVLADEWDNVSWDVYGVDLIGDHR